MGYITCRKRYSLAVFALAVVFACVLFGCRGPSSTYSQKDDSHHETETTYSTEKAYDFDRYEPAPLEPTYADPRWPTNHPDLLAIPESNRWYNAWSYAWTTCTVAGPVVNVYQAAESDGMPIFVDIGASYPDPNSVTLLIWGDQYYDFAEMLNDVDDGGSWISVTGYLSVYNDNLQFNAGDGYVEYTWWNNVS